MVEERNPAIKMLIINWEVTRTDKPRAVVTFNVYTDIVMIVIVRYVTGFTRTRSLA